MMVMLCSNTVIDHFENPRNVGTLDVDDDRVGTGKIGEANNGDVMHLQIRVNDDGVIEEAKFKTLGSAFAIATVSFVTELITGKTLEQIRKLRFSDLTKALSLPKINQHCSVMVEDVLRAAINDYQTKQA